MGDTGVLLHQDPQACHPEGVPGQQYSWWEKPEAELWEPHRQQLHTSCSPFPVHCPSTVDVWEEVPHIQPIKHSLNLSHCRKRTAHTSPQLPWAEQTGPCVYEALALKYDRRLFVRTGAFPHTTAPWSNALIWAINQSSSAAELKPVMCQIHWDFLFS